jgi:hypothetical protein
MYFEEAQVSFSVMGLWGNMGWLARCVVILLFIMSIWSLAVIIDRALYFSAARKQSREFAPKVAGALKDGRLDEAIKVADRSKKSHLAEVVTAGLQEFRSFGSGGSITPEQVESSKRALERSEAIVHAKLKRGLGGLATIGSSGPVYRPVRHRGRYFERLPADCNPEDLGYAQSPAVSRSPGNDGVRSSRRHPGRYDVQTSPARWRRSTSRWTTAQRIGGLLHQAEPPVRFCLEA